ncbi:hypothetical protein HDU98_000701 [Podochytrium sp. JEL0797]|nr:hypothetical protein HDU98_000701 [Podochytrium sp. JEL0797]
MKSDSTAPLLAKFRPTSDKVQISADGNILSFTLIEPSTSDYALAVGLFSLLALTLSYTSIGYILQLAAITSSVLLCTLFIDDTHTTTINKLEGTIRVTKSRFSRVSRIRVAQVSETVALHIVEDKISLKRNGFALEVEVLSGGGIGYMRVRCADTLVVGEAKIKMLRNVKADVETFLGLQQNPFVGKK